MALLRRGLDGLSIWGPPSAVYIEEGIKRGFAANHTQPVSLSWRGNARDNSTNSLQPSVGETRFLPCSHREAFQEGCV